MKAKQTKQNSVTARKTTPQPNAPKKTAKQLREERKIKEYGYESALDLFKDNARQFNEGLIAAKNARVGVYVYKDCTGAVHRRYWNGATFETRSSALYEGSGRYAVKGTYSAEWQPRQTPPPKARTSSKPKTTTAKKTTVKKATTKK